MQTEMFRTLPERGAGRVDRNAHVIEGVVLASPREAKGHGLAFDAVTVGQVVQLINTKAAGVKSRFTGKINKVTVEVK